MTRRSANPSTRRWRKLRAAKLAANPICELCDAAQAVEVDHILPLSEGGERFAWDNLRSVCDRCHKKRHGKRPKCGFTVDGEPKDPDHPWNRAA